MSRMKSEELNTKVNPTSDTAITTLIMLANAGYEKAAEILECMGVEKETFFQEIDPEDMINRPSDIARELRYVALNRTIEESGYKTLMDLPCGYTPKVFDFIDKGMNYIGCDLPAVINAFAPVIDAMTDEEQKSHIEFCIVDATNYDSMKEAADKAKGPVCIATEGLTVYLSQNENNQLRQNIRKILSEKGGCWLNADLETTEYFMAAYEAVGKEKAAEMMQATMRGFGGQSDTNFDQNKAGLEGRQTKKGVGSLDFDKIEALYKANGLLVEKIPYYREDLTLLLFDKMSKEEIDRLKENTRHVNIWKATVDPDYADNVDKREKCKDTVNIPFKVRSENIEGVLRVSVSGRMDTITAPELLKQFQEAGDDIKEIIVDVSRMSYVSSAGLRVLLMMYKSLEDKDRFKMTGVSDDVREILETTGFDQFFL